MPWVTTTEAARFAGEAHEFLAADPVAHTMLLGETDLWTRLPDAFPTCRAGWWVAERQVRGAFVQMPDHPLLCSRLDPDAARELPTVIGDASRIGVDSGDVPVVTAALGAEGRRPRTVRELAVLRLEELRPVLLPGGEARLAGHGDLPMLHAWFAEFRARFPDDTSHVAFVVDQPVTTGGLVLWEVDGEPVAMSSRTAELGDMVRMGLSFQPGPGTTYADAAFHAGCAQAASRVEHVLVVSGSAGSTAAYEALGFRSAAGRTLLEW
jgi:hypothetical protein